MLLSPHLLTHSHAHTHTPTHTHTHTHIHKHAHTHLNSHILVLCAASSSFRSLCSNELPKTKTKKRCILGSFCSFFLSSTSRALFPLRHVIRAARTRFSFVCVFASLCVHVCICIYVYGCIHRISPCYVCLYLYIHGIYLYQQFPTLLCHMRCKDQSVNVFICAHTPSWS